MANKKKPKKEKKIIKKKPVVLKKKKKKWASIIAPKEFGGKEIGESLIIDPQDLKGRKVILSLSNLGRGRNSSIKIIFQVADIVEGNGICEPIGYYVLPGFARRIVKKGKTKIYGSFKLRTKNNVNVVLKMALVTRTKIPRGIKRSMREELIGFIREEMKKNTFNNVLNSIVEYKLQKKIKESMKKVYPVASLEILKFNKINV
jgi:small subunit ribosomal protein S3Ae